MEIVLCTDSNLIKQTSVLIHSIIFCNPHELLNFHIFTLDVKKTEEEIFLCFNNKNIKTKIYSISEKDFTLLPIHMSYITKGTYLRFFIESFLPENITKVLYLDIDTIVCKSLTPLWNEDLSNYAIAAAKDVECDDICRYNRLDYDHKDSYFNAGVLLINLSYWRKQKISKKAIDFLTEHPEKCTFHDQDALNHILHGSVKFISNKYNAIYAFFKKDSDSLLLEKEKLSSIKKEIENPIIIHYAGKLKPWHHEYYNFNYPFGQIWQFFRQKTNTPCKLIHYKPKQSKNLRNCIKQLFNLLHLLKSEKEKIKEAFIDTHELEEKILNSLKQEK